LFLLTTQAQAQAANWPQWGGPQRNFMVEAKGLAETWPASGPKRLWSRPLGEGHSSVIVEADRLYTMYSKGEQEFVVALDRATGKMVWEKSYAAPTTGLNLENERGPHATPLIAGNLLITVGVTSKLQAFEKQTGAVVWSHDLWREYGGTVKGRGYSCSCGGFNITAPVWGADNILFISSAYECGSRAMLLRQAGGKTAVKELWANQRMRVHHSTIIRLGDLVFGSSPALLTAVNVKTGEVVWQDRAFPKANFVYADGKLILLDEDGQLALVRVSPQGMNVMAKAAVLEHTAWTPPTLVGANLYLRDRRTIVALDLR